MAIFRVCARCMSAYNAASPRSKLLRRHALALGACKAGVRAWVGWLENLYVLESQSQILQNTRTLRVRKSTSVGVRTDGRTDGRLEPRCTRCSAAHLRGALPATQSRAMFIFTSVVLPRHQQRVLRSILVVVAVSDEKSLRKRQRPMAIVVVFVRRRRRGVLPSPPRAPPRAPPALAATASRAPLPLGCRLLRLRGRRRPTPPVLVYRR